MYVHTGRPMAVLMTKVAQECIDQLAVTHPQGPPVLLQSVFVIVQCITRQIISRVDSSTRSTLFVTQAPITVDYSLNMIKMIDSGSGTKRFVNFSTMSGILTLRRNKHILFPPLFASPGADVVTCEDTLPLNYQISKKRLI